MKFKRTLCIVLLFIAACLNRFNAMAQVPNPCGVVAHIWPEAVDSVVPANTVINFISTSINATSVEWLLDGTPSGITGPNFNYQISTGLHVISLVAYNSNCSDTTTVVYFAAGTAHNIDSLLIAHYGSYSFNEEGICMDRTPDSGFVIGGVQYPWNSCGEIGILVKLRNRGCVDWSRKFLSPYYCNYSRITSVAAASDSSYYVVNENIELARLNKNGNLVWNQRLDINNQGPIYLPIICAGPQAEVYTVSQAYNNGWTINRLDSNGHVTWNKFYRLSNDPGSGPGQTEFSIPSGMLHLNGKIYVCGNAYSLANATYFSFITKLDAVTGAKEWQYGYVDPDYPGAVGFTSITLYDTLLMVSSGAQGQIVTLIDQQGQVRKSIKTHFSTSYGPQASVAGTRTDRHIYMMQWVKEPLPLQPYFQYYTNFAEIDTSLNKYMGMVFSDYSRPYFADAKMGVDNKFGAVGTDYGFVTDGIYASRDFRFMKVDTVIAEQFCFARDTSYTIAVKTINRLNFQYLVDSVLSIIPSAGTPFIVVNAAVGSRYNCQDFVDSCSFMKITGPVRLCSLADTYTYRMHRNKRCTLSPQWQIPPGVVIVSQTDSSLSLRFPALGQYHILADLYSCIPVEDSLVVTVASGSHSLNIGNDTSICPGTIIRLHAANDFIAYLWNDGSTDSLLNVSQPGIYWVRVTDSCNNQLVDSITISPFNIPISVGPDRTKCNTDTVHLNGPPGFLNYTWSNNFYINATNIQNVVVDPPVDTAYYLKAEKLPGCFSFDTVRIFVKNSPPIQLGSDKSFCTGDSAILNAGPGFIQYLWSNGRTTQQIFAHTIGSYSVIGTTTDGCKSYDTIRIVNIWPNPVPALNHNLNLCIGAQRVLSPGNFNSYLWQDGTTAATYYVNTLGTYYVMVIDNNQCRGSDTVHIVNLVSGPSKFLPADSTICSYGEIVLIPSGVFSSYLWNTGQSTVSIKINQPGLYWLKVSDKNSCVSTDTIKVLLKDCIHGFFAPSAFTPNKDGKNDLFRPLLFGNVKLFEWKIYNRYGQLVYASSNNSAGWDGTFGGQKQESDTYVWICHYRLEGEQEHVKSGTVTLLR